MNRSQATGFVGRRPPALRNVALGMGLLLVHLASAGQDAIVPGLPAGPIDATAANPAPATALGADLERQVRRLALDGSHAGAPGAPRIAVALGQLDPRLRLAPCQRIEPYLPSGTRLWGKSRIGLRCIDGPTKWNVYLPIAVQVFGRALVATTAAPAGGVLTAADLAQAEVDLAEEASAAVTDAGLAVGRTLTQPLKAGQGLRASHLKPRLWFSAGETIKVRARGDGFSVAAEAQAMTHGIEGQTARVRTDSGRVLSGQPVGARELELML